MAGCRPLPEGHRGLQPPRARDGARPVDPAPAAAAPWQQVNAMTGDSASAEHWAE